MTPASAPPLASPRSRNHIEWSRVEVVVFDVDGTLYDASPLRRRMLLALAANCLRHPSAISDVRILRRFRICREELAREAAVGVARAQFKRPAAMLGVTPEKVERVVEDWMYERPLAYLRSCRFPGVGELFGRLRSSDRRIAVLSDYPAQRKLAALGLEANVVVSALDPEVDRLKPRPEGLERVLDICGVEPQRAVFVGDREETDGDCARQLRVPFLRKVSSSVGAAHEFCEYRDLAREMQA